MSAINGVEHPVHPEEVMELLDGELPVERAAIVQGHVNGCAACRELIDGLGSVSRRMTEWNVEDPPATLRAPRPVEHLPAKHAWSFSLPRLPRPLIAFSIAGFGIAGVFAAV